MEQLTQDANYLLARLVKFQAAGDPLRLVQGLFSAEEDTSIVTDKMERALYERSCETPIGVYVGSTAQLSVLGPPMADYPAAIKLLKLTQRILQVGRGRGKGIIIIDDTPVSDGELEGAIIQASPRPKFEPTQPEPQLSDWRVGPPPASPEPVEDFVMSSQVDKKEMLAALDNIRQAAVENLSMIERMRDQIEST